MHKRLRFSPCHPSVVANRLSSRQRAGNPSSDVATVKADVGCFRNRLATFAAVCFLHLQPRGTNRVDWSPLWPTSRHGQNTMTRVSFGAHSLAMWNFAHTEIIHTLYYGQRGSPRLAQGLLATVAHSRGTSTDQGGRFRVRIACAILTLNV